MPVDKETLKKGEETRKRILEAKMVEKRIAEKMKNIKHKIMVLSGKGGVGKTTVAVNLAVTLALKGYKVGLLDADIHGPNVPKMLGVQDAKLTVSPEGLIIPVEPVPNLKAISLQMALPQDDSPIIWRGPLKHKAIQQLLDEVDWGKLDFLIIDMPPGTGDESLSVSQLIPDMDGVLIVATPQEVALLDATKAINFARQLQKKVVGIVENMAGEIFGQGGGKKAAEKYNVPFIGSIPMDARIVKCGDTGEPFVMKYPESEAAKAFENAVDKLLEVLGEK
ncbi:Mrp/NBP35 family ATP-binding protein [Candidatus Aciduliprofundum boonei]|uniref:Iron-sulfur cluster carrier protein n=1 Tax=Aciduliprofundum boonei (strain DSM 19572 / T469) TaxID=439481 RepID=B5IA32_ACIB4|nr:Mrp/NBP35 family ATP-binding protein [Candidatus Aciduliprofundum boonei]ADD08333.1 ATPase-like, ParA/MinD [Aciduliprofundum boonei T469]EDY36796.1 CobQ/CobB/MinD/ParA nucleotide binding domain, putative [Aciduliprofundum boonei T469]HII54677.1 Mrp/NBP35 family ATP-binding protein [Candidatus Aciduliprofundum boonei]